MKTSDLEPTLNELAEQILKDALREERLDLRIDAFKAVAAHELAKAKVKSKDTDDETEGLFSLRAAKRQLAAQANGEDE